MSRQRGRQMLAASFAGRMTDVAVGGIRKSDFSWRRKTSIDASMAMNVLREMGSSCRCQSDECWAFGDSLIVWLQIVFKKGENVYTIL